MARSDGEEPTAPEGDLRAIYDLMVCYCRGVDRGDLELVRSTYHPDAVDRHAGFEGTVDEFVDWLSETISKFVSTTHIIGNHRASVRGDRAVSETYGMGIHRVADPHDPLNFTSGVRYVDRLEKRGGKWGIIERWAVRDWTRSDAGLLVPLGDGPRGTRGPSDPIYRALGWLTEA